MGSVLPPGRSSCTLRLQSLKLVRRSDAFRKKKTGLRPFLEAWQFFCLESETLGRAPRALCPRSRPEPRSLQLGPLLLRGRLRFLAPEAEALAIARGVWTMSVLRRPEWLSPQEAGRSFRGLASRLTGCMEFVQSNKGKGGLLGRFRPFGTPGEFGRVSCGVGFGTVYEQGLIPSTHFPQGLKASGRHFTEGERSVRD